MKILVANTKHQTYYFKWDTEEEQQASALKLFETNDELSYYYNISDPADFKELENEVEELKSSIKEIEELKNPSRLRLNLLANTKSDLAVRESELKERKLCHSLYLKAKAGNSDAAFKLLKRRQFHEYEDFTIEEVV